ncbi:MAG: hypothetical protein OSB41_11810, partial [Kiritimatiellae bacterium]|nr:hypothetical protein [Kiritimatiellia bacterium]
MPIQKDKTLGISVLTEKELHRDHIQDIVPCFNPFTDKVYVYAGGMPSRYADTDTDDKGRLVETQLLTPDVHGWYTDGDECRDERYKYHKIAAIARPVSKKELETSEKAQTTIKDEWDRLIALKVWSQDIKDVKSWDEVRADFAARNEEVHVGRLFAIIVEKNAELEPGNPLRKFKGRVVFQGNEVKDQNYEVAMFQDLSASPATMPASKAADLFGALPGHATEQADAVHAYTQAKLEGTKTYVRLPYEVWPSHFHGIKDPVCPLRLALYGHVNSGAYWENHCDARLQLAGFQPIPEWRSGYFHEDLKLFLTVYVDDFKLSGPKENLAAGWALIREKIDTDPPEAHDRAENSERYLGCLHHKSTETLTWQGRNITDTIEKIPDPKEVNVVTHDMEFFWTATCETYRDLTGVDVQEMPAVRTPFPAETLEDFGLGTDRDTQLDIKVAENEFEMDRRAAAMGAAAVRALATRTAAEKIMDCALANIRKLVFDLPDDHDTLPRDPKTMAFMAAPAARTKPAKPASSKPAPTVRPPCPQGKRRAKAKPKKKAKKADRPLTEKELAGAVDDPKLEGAAPGRLQPIAARILMKLLYGARMARYDILRAIAYLATCVTKWTAQCDRDLHHLMLYVSCTRHLRQVSWCGDSIEDLTLKMYADADFAGCTRTQRSTSGIILMMVGPHTRFLQSAIAKRQSAVAHCTTEAEMIAAALGFRAEGIPFQILWDVLRRATTPAGEQRTHPDVDDPVLPPIPLTLEEDNQAMIKICHNKNWQKLRHLSRTHRVNGAFINECVHEPRHCIDIKTCKTADMAADICTKRFTDARTWHKLLYLNNIVDPPLFWKSKSFDEYLTAMTPIYTYAAPAITTEVYGKGQALQKGMMPKWRYITEDPEDELPPSLNSFSKKRQFKFCAPAKRAHTASRVNPRHRRAQLAKRSNSAAMTNTYNTAQIAEHEHTMIDVPEGFRYDLQAMLE